MLIPKVLLISRLVSWDLEMLTQFDYYFGFAAHHITMPDQGFIGESRLPMKITANIGATFPLNRFGTYRTNSE